MRTILQISCLLLAGAFLIAGCGEDAPPPPQPRVPQQTTPAKKAAPVTPPAPESGSKTGDENKSNVPGAWPFLDGDEAPLELADDLLARNYLLIFDGSGSMAEVKCSGSRPKIEVAKEAVVHWASSIPERANLGLYVFHNDRRTALPLGSGPRDEFNRTVRSVDPGGGTPLSDAFIIAYRELTKQGMRQLGYGEYTIVVVTDGIANDANRLANTVDIILANSPITVYSIGFCIGDRHSLNQPGKTVYKSAGNPEQLAEGLQDVLAESEFFDAAEFERQ